MTRGKTDAMRDLEHEMSVLIRRIRRVMVLRAQFVHPDLNAVSYSVLTNLADTGPKRATEIADTFAIDKGAVSRQVQQLVDLDLVDRTPDPNDGRASILQLSALGRSRLDAVNRNRRKFLDDRLAEWSAADLSDFVGWLSRYNASLD
jgi:DNA-binding MarR family transcriptional regulator